jgi:IclR family acetate operon transcriptional repressor
VRRLQHRVCIDVVESSLPIRRSVPLGETLPLFAGPSGKAILAFLPTAQQEQILGAGPLRPFTAHTIVDPMLLRLELERTRQRGYAIDREEIIPGVHCVAVPILNYTGHAVGALSIAGTVPKAEGERLDALVVRVKAAGDFLSRRLGFLARGEDGTTVTVNGARG